jgi:hypothetical protein
VAPATPWSVWLWTDHPTAFGGGPPKEAKNKTKQNKKKLQVSGFGGGRTSPKGLRVVSATPNGFSFAFEATPKETNQDGIQHNQQAHAISIPAKQRTRKFTQYSQRNPPRWYPKLDKSNIPNNQYA